MVSIFYGLYIDSWSNGLHTVWLFIINCQKMSQAPSHIGYLDDVMHSILPTLSGSKRHSVYVWLHCTILIWNSVHFVKLIVSWPGRWSESCFVCALLLSHLRFCQELVCGSFSVRVYDCFLAIFNLQFLIFMLFINISFSNVLGKAL